MNILKYFKSVRYCLGAVNVIFLISGIFLSLVGTVILAQNYEYEELITNKFFTLPAFVIATGVIIIFTSALGFYGALSGSFYFIAGYVVLLLVILVFEIAMTAVAFNLKDGAGREIRSTMLQSLALYESKLEVAKIWDDLQMEFECCGIAGRHDWPSHRIPISCCHIDYGTVSPFECTVFNSYLVGCENALGNYLAGNVNVIAVSALTVTCLQVLVAAASAWLAWRSKFEEVELES